MSTEILGTWFTQVVYICGLPVIAIIWALGLRQDAGMEVLKKVAVFGPPGQTDGLFLLQVIATSAMTLFLIGIYPILVAMLYGMLTYVILHMSGMDAGAIGLNIIITNCIGFAIGLKTGAWLLPKIDARFGIQDGMFLPLKVFLTAGAVYVSVKVLKAGKQVLTKL